MSDRTLGRVQIVLGVLLALAGAYVALFYAWQAVLGVAAFFVGVGLYDMGREALWVPENAAQLAEKLHKSGLGLEESHKRAHDAVEEYGDAEKAWRVLRQVI